MYYEAWKEMGCWTKLGSPDPVLGGNEPSLAHKKCKTGERWIRSGPSGSPGDRSQELVGPESAGGRHGELCLIEESGARGVGVVAVPGGRQARWVELRDGGIEPIQMEAVRSMVRLPNC